MTTIAYAPGTTDSIADITGIRVAHGHDEKVISGTTVILPENPVVMGVDVRGGGPGTRDTPALDPTCLVDTFHGLTLSGGSVFGLAAADGMTRVLSDRGIGLMFGPRALPVIPAAILFDLMNGGDKGWDKPPYADLAATLTEGLLDDPDRNDGAQMGAVGAGHGAIAGGYKGGIGTASFTTPDGLTVAAMIAVNSFGNPTAKAGHEEAPLGTIDTPKAGLLAGNTTIGVIATNADLDKAGCQRVAIMAQDGLARAIRPLHTPYDGDTLFTMATGQHSSQLLKPAYLTLIGHLAADTAEQAIARAIKASNG